MSGREPARDSARERPIVAIDGPAGSGKSTAGKKLAARMGFLYIDTGSLYRAVAWLAAQKGITPENPAGLVELIEKTEIGLENAGETRRVTVDGRDVSGEIRSEAAGHLASAFSALPEVREALLGIQRRLGSGGGVVMDGRGHRHCHLPRRGGQDFSLRRPRREKPETVAGAEGTGNSG